MKKGMTEKTITSLLWMLSGSGMQAVLRTLVLFILARLLLPADFGLVRAALVVVGFATLFSQLGMMPAIVQRPQLEENHLRTGFTASILLGFILFAGVYLAAPIIASFFQFDGLIPVLRVIALFFPLQGTTVVANALMRRELRFRWLAKMDVITYFIGYGVVGVLLAFLGFGVWALVGAHLSRGLVRATLLLSKKPHPKKLQLDGQAFKELMYFGGGFTLARVFNFTALQGDNAVVGRVLGAEALGYYGQAYQLLVFPVRLFGSVIDQVLFPTMAKVQADAKRLELAFRRGIALIALFFAPLSVFALILAPEIVLVGFGEQWLPSVEPFRVLGIGMLFRASYKMSDSIARATGAVYQRAWRQGVYAFFVVGGTWVGHHWGLAGVAAGVLLALTINFFLMTSLTISLTTMTWRKFAAAHLPAFFLAAITLVETSLAASFLRFYALPDLLVLVVAASIVALTLLALLYFSPGLFGPDGLWMLQTLTKMVDNKIKVPAWIKKMSKQGVVG